MNRVIVVSDSGALLSQCSEFLTRTGFRVLTAEDDETALQLVASAPIVACLADTLVGPGFFPEIGRLQSQAGRVLLSTTLDEDPHEWGAHLVLLKPIDFFVLERRIRKWIDARVPSKS